MAHITPVKALAARITGAKNAAGLTDSELSERTLIPRTTLQRKLAGAVEFTVGELDSLAETLDLDLAELVAEYASAKAAA